MDRRTRIAVVGAGLGGMTVAGLLQRQGFAVTVYEQAPAFSRIGAGIILSANAMKVLRRLEIEQAVADTGIKAQSYVSRAWDSGDVLYQIAFDAGSEVRYGGTYVNIHRGDLHRIMGTSVAEGSISFNHRLIGLEERSEFVRLTFDNGTMVDADIVIGADGVNSSVRTHLLGAEPPRFIGAVAHRAIFPSEELRGLKIPDCTKWWGPDRHILVYYITSKRDEVYVIGILPQDKWETDAASVPGTREALMEGFASFHCDLRDVLEVTRDVSVWPVFDRSRDDRWSRGRIVLLGDSCHAVRPFMAAGGAMAIEDAAILSRCLAQLDTPAEAFRCYERTRIDRVGEVQRISIENTWMRGPTDVEWFYCYDPCDAPLAPPREAELRRA